jgi:hypothetical protein
VTRVPVVLPITSGGGKMGVVLDVIADEVLARLPPISE